MRPLQLETKRFGRLLVLKRASITNIKLSKATRIGTYWVCICDCGKEKVVRTQELRSGATQSCGCWRLECLQTNGVTHGHARGKNTSRVYRIWRSMLRRCFNKNCKEYGNYGGRGITVCEQWKNSFESFLDSMGEPYDFLTLDRWPNNDGNYEPGNCRWATPKQQSENRRAIKYLKTCTDTELLSEVSRRGLAA